MNYIFSILLTLSTINLIAQQGKVYDFDIIEGTIEDNLLLWTDEHKDIDIAYSSAMVSQYKVPTSAKLKAVSVDYALDLLLTQSDLTYVYLGSQYLINRRADHVVRIQVLDALTGDGVPYAIIREGKKGAQADVNGIANHVFESGRYTLHVDALGYQALAHTVSISRSDDIKISLHPDDVDYQVVITDSAYSESVYHYEQYDSRQLQFLTTNAPGLGGINDVMHTVRSLPGVQSGGGGIGGHYVRGSSNGENFVLLEDAPVYFPYHALGLASILDGSYVKDIQVYKAGFDPKYGGRSSSVVDVHVMKGNRNRWGGKLDASTQAGSMMLHGPVFSSNSSLLLYGRHSTWLQGFDKIINDNFTSISETKAKFYDILAKYDHDLTENTTLKMMMYDGRDKIADSGDTLARLEELGLNSELGWSNHIYSFSLRQKFSPQSFLKASFFQSEFENVWKEFDSSDQFSFVENANNIRHRGVKLDADYYNSRLQSFSAGLSYNQYDMGFSSRYFTGEDVVLDSLDDEVLTMFGDSILSNAYEIRAYAKHDYNWKNFNVQYGFNVSHFKNGKDTYFQFEPRFNLTYRQNPGTHWTASVAKMTQYLHLSSPSGVSFPQDLWLPSGSVGELVKGLYPISTWHYDIGLHWKFSPSYLLDVNVYYKDIKNVIATNDLFLDQLDSVRLTGEGKGIEFNLRKMSGRWKGNLSYAISKSNRVGNTYNKGNSFDFQFDRRHEIKLLSTWDVYKGWIIGTTGYIGTSHPKLIVLFADLNSGLFPKDDENLGSKNVNRSKSHYRVDLSLRKEWKTKPISHAIKFSLYNVSDNINPIIYFADDNNRERPGLTIPPLFAVQYTATF